MNKLICTVLSFSMMCFTAACSGNSEEVIPLPQSVSTVRESENNTEAAKSDTDIPSENAEQSNAKEENILGIEITVGDRTFSAKLYDNETAEKFAEMLPLTLDMNELNGNEKYYYLESSLPKNSSVPPSGIHTGDIMLYGSNCLVLFYDSFSTSYSYTPIGCVNDPDELAAALGSENVTVTFKSAK